MLTILPQLFLLLPGCMFEIDSIAFGIWSSSFGLSLLAVWPLRPVYGILGGYDYMDLISRWPLGLGIHMPYFPDPLFSGFPVSSAKRRHWRETGGRKRKEGTHVWLQILVASLWHANTSATKAPSLLTWDLNPESFQRAKTSLQQGKKVLVLKYEIGKSKWTKVVFTVYKR